MPDKTKWDISNENFDFFFHKLAATMTEEQKNILPKDLYFKLFKRGGDFDAKSTAKMSFLSKLFVLMKSLKKKCIIMIEDEKEGMTVEEFFKYKDLLKNRQFTISGADELIEDAIFVLGNNELVDTYSALNELSTSNAYNYCIQTRDSFRPKKIQNRAEKNKKAQSYIAKLFSDYEANRKRIHMNSGLNIVEFITLLAFYDDQERSPKDIYEYTYKHSFNASSNKIKLAFSSLNTKGLIDKWGKTRNAKMKITPLGKLKINDIIKEYIFRV